MWEVLLYLIFSFDWWGEVILEGGVCWGVGLRGLVDAMEVGFWVDDFGVWLEEGVEEGVMSFVMSMMEMGSRLTDYQKLYVFPYDTER